MGLGLGSEGLRRRPVTPELGLLKSPAGPTVGRGSVPVLMSRLLLPSRRRQTPLASHCCLPLLVVTATALDHMKPQTADEYRSGFDSVWVQNGSNVPKRLQGSAGRGRPVALWCD